MSFDRFIPSGEVQLELPFGKPDNRQRMAGLSGAIDAINGRYGRTLIGYGQCGAQGGYTGAKITYGRIPEWGRFLVVPLRLGDYAEGDWFFLAICGTCGREAILEPSDILARAGTGNVHGGMHLSDLEALLRCRDCLSRRARLEPVARIRKQNFVAGMI